MTQSESRSFRHLWDKYASKDRHGYQDWMGPDGFQGAIEDAVAELRRELGLERESHEITKRMLDDATTASSEIRALPEHVNICTVPGCGMPALDQPKSAGRSVCFDHDPGR